MTLAQHGVHGKGGVQVKLLSQKDIIEKVDGKKTKATMVEVTLAPGGVEPAHRHPGAAFGYILEGEYEWAIDGNKPKIFKAGDTFYEPTGCLHDVGRVLEFFETSTRNILAAEAAAGVKHHVALSIAGADSIPDSGYMRAKVAQETLIKASGVPYTILRATQFFEFLGAIAGPSPRPGTDAVRLPDAPMQPLAADDVAAALADVAMGPPAGGILEVAGPETLPISVFVGKALAASGDKRRVVTDPQARYYGAALDHLGLRPRGPNPRIAPTRFEAWLDRSAARL